MNATIQQNPFIFEFQEMTRTTYFLSSTQRFDYLCTKEKISCKIPRDQAKTDVFKPATKLTKISLPKNVFKNSRYVGLPFCPSLPLLHRPTELLLVRATFSQISWYLRHSLEQCYIFSQTFFLILNFLKNQI